MNISPDLLPVFPQVTSHHAAPTFCSGHRLLTDLTRLKYERRVRLGRSFNMADALSLS